MVAAQPINGKRPTKGAYVTADEEADALTAIAAQLGFEPPHPAGYFVLVKTWIPPDELMTVTRDGGEVVTLIRPYVSQVDAKFQSLPALVLGVGPLCYQGDVYKKSGPWCRVGDWVLVPRHESFPFLYRKVAMQLITDDKILMVIDDPSHIESIHVSAKI